jgi:hypothetical protein
MAQKEPTLFICYSHTDQKYREQFSKFLKTPRLQGTRIFSDAAIEPGEQWQQTILAQLAQATAALILVSQDFMISPFIQQVELRELLAGYIRDGLRLFLVPVRSTNYQGTYLEQFQWARPPDKPLALLTPEQQEEAMVAICLTIASALGEKEPVSQATAERTIDSLNRVPKLDLPSVYEIEEPLGEGEFARCFRARDQLLDKTIIIKVLNTPLSQDSPGYDKYVRSASRLTHRNILNLLFSQANKLPHFIVTPAVGDDTLKRRLEVGSIAIADALDWTITLAEALAYAHSKSCVHGRIRSCEVRFDAENQLVLSGFRTLEGLRAAPAPPCAERRLTLEEFVASSPEQRENATINASTDQYQLGLLAYEMIAGAPPVRATSSSWASVLDPATAHTLLHPRPLRDFVPGCSERVSDVVMRMLSVDPAARWDSLEPVMAILRAERGSVPWVEQAKASYRRCAQDTHFYETLYTKLFEAVPGIEAMFVGRSMEQQYQVLRDALWLLLSFKQSDEQDEPTILTGIARSHAHFEPRLFDAFRDAVLEAVQRHDPEGAAAAAAWRAAMASGLDYLKARAGKAVYARA